MGAYNEIPEAANATNTFSQGNEYGNHDDSWHEYRYYHQIKKDEEHIGQDNEQYL